jgi:hypothetical protein
VPAARPHDKPTQLIFGVDGRALELQARQAVERSLIPQASLLAITESDELADPNRIWSIGGVVGTDPALTDTWVFELTEPGTGAISDVVGVISTTGGGTAIAFMSDAENGSTVFLLVRTPQPLLRPQARSTSAS